MRRRIQPPTNGHTAATAPTTKSEIPIGTTITTTPSSSSSFKSGGSAASRRRKSRIKKMLAFALGMLVILTAIWTVLRWLFPKHRYHHLLEISEIKTLLEDAPAPVNDEYVVFVSNANGKRNHYYNIAHAKSSTSAEHALKEALTKIPLASARYPWFKIDIVTAVRDMEAYDSSSRHNYLPSWWYGLALDWDKGWVFLPDEVQAHGLVDWKNRLLWDRIGKFASERNLQQWPDTVLEDDSTVLANLEVLHTNAILCDFSKKEIIPLYHGHRMFPKLTHGLLVDAAERAGDYLTRSTLPDGKFVYLYRPMSDSEPDEYGLVRHAGVIYSMAVLYQEYRNPDLNAAMTRALEYLMTFLHDCELPYDPSRTEKCLWEYDKKSHAMTKLGLNALAILAIAEYTKATHDLQFLDTAKSMAAFIVASQKEDGSFVQKIGEPDNKVDEDYYVRYYQGEATFGLARLYNVVKDLKDQDPPLQEWMTVADLAATCIVDRDAQLADDDLLVDHWLMYGIAEMQSHKKQHMAHLVRTITVASERQVQETSPGEEKDRLGIFGGSISGTATATKTEGFCAVYHLFVKKKPELATTILETATLATRFQLQVQYRPETAMYFPDPTRILGGFHSSLNNYEMRNDFTQHNLCSFLCMARLLKEQEVAWDQ